MSKSTLPLPAFVLGLACIFPVSQTALHAAETETAELVQAVNRVGRDGEGHKDAIAAFQHLDRAPAAEIPSILAGMENAGPLAENWLRNAVETIAQRELAAGNSLPTAGIEAFLTDTKNAPRGRRLAFELLASADPAAREQFLPTMLNDPSLELRREAIARALEQAKGNAGAPQEERLVRYREILTAARDTDQVDEAAARLRELGEEVDLAKHFGFIQKWHIIGPFDNTEGRGFDTAYPPEQEIDLAARYPGKTEEIGWITYTTEDGYGELDLTKALDKHKGAVAYAWCEFEAAEERPIELRLGCINANKIWLNGELLTANQVYHARTFVDQYIGRGKLLKGTNQILLKICQNEQTEDWAQRWHFQIRACDHLGTAVLAENR